MTVPEASPWTSQAAQLSLCSPSANSRVSSALLSPDRHTCTRSDLLALFPRKTPSLWRWRPHDPHLGPTVRPSPGRGHH